MDALPFGNRNYVLRATARQHYWQGAGQLSIKTFRGGESFYESNGGRFRVNDSSYLVLNHGQPYAVTVDADRPVESFCVFFAPGFAEDVLRGSSERAERLLTDPWGYNGDRIQFYERTYPHDDILSPALRRLHDAGVSGYCERGALTEGLHDVIQALLRVHRGVVKEVESLPAARAATREELYRRLHLARDLMHAAYGNRLSLEDLARVACMSPHHFLRTFKRAFGQTPHQYLTTIRLRQAEHLLTRTDQPITDICLAVGFESPSSFSGLFRQHAGASPRDYRARRVNPQFSRSAQQSGPYNGPYEHQ